MGRTPSVSVLLPTRNRATLLPRALGSALEGIRQVDGELIVLDNASSDSTSTLLKAYRGQKGVRLVRHARDLGMVGNWNAGLELARAPYVVVLHDDDALLPGALAEALQAHHQRPGLAFTFGAFRVVGSNGGSLLTHYPLGSRAERVLDPDQAWAWLFYYFCPVTMATVCFDAHFLRERGGFKAEAGLAADAEAYLRLAAERPIAYLPEVLAAYGHHGANLSAGMTQGMAGTLAAIARGVPLPPALKGAGEGVRSRLEALLRARDAANSAWSWRRKGMRGAWKEAVQEALSQADLLPPSLRQRRLSLLQMAGDNWLLAGLAERLIRLLYFGRRRWGWLYASPQRCQEMLARVMNP